MDIWSEEIAEELPDSLNTFQSGTSGARHFSPGAQQKLYAALKQSSKTYRELEVLVTALKVLHDWRLVEDEAIE